MSSCEQDSLHVVNLAVLPLDRELEDRQRKNDEMREEQEECMPSSLANAVLNVVCESSFSSSRFFSKGCLPSQHVSNLKFLKNSLISLSSRNPANNLLYSTTILITGNLKNSICKTR